MVSSNASHDGHDAITWLPVPGSTIGGPLVWRHMARSATGAPGAVHTGRTIAKQKKASTEVINLSTRTYQEAPDIFWPFCLAFLVWLGQLGCQCPPL